MNTNTCIDGEKHIHDFRPNLVIRDYRAGDETGIARLFEDVFGKPLTLSQWRWKYQGQPAEKTVFVKVAETQDGQIVGHVGAISLRGILHGQSMPFFQVTDVMVNPSWRGKLGSGNIYHCLFKELINRISIQAESIFCYGFPGLRPFALGERVGLYSRVERAALCSHSGSHHGAGWLKAQQIDWMDDRLDSLWHKRKKQISMALVRDRAYLDWRYAKNPFYTYRLMGIFFIGILLGWVVIRQEKADCYVVDLLIHPGLCKPVVQAVRKFVEKSGMNGTLYYWLPEKWRSKCCQAMTNSEVIVTNVIWRLPMPTEVVRENFYYTMGDADIF